MKTRHALTSMAAAAAIAGTILLTNPAQTAPTTTYEQSSAMAGVVALDAAPTASFDGEQRRIVGVAKALAAGFKAATAPQAAGNVARLASILGFAADTPRTSAQVESAYFDR